MKINDVYFYIFYKMKIHEVNILKIIIKLKNNFDHIKILKLTIS